MNYRGIYQMNQIFWCLSAGALLLSGCNGADQSVSEPVVQKRTSAQQKVTKVAPTIVPANEPAIEPTAVPIKQATSGARDKLAGGAATKKSRRVAAFDLKRFKVARTLEVPYYSDSISKFAFSPDGKTVAGVGVGRSIVFLFDATTGVLLKRLTPRNRDEGFDSFVWSPDGKSVAAWYAEPIGRAKTLCVWNIKSGQVTARFSTPKWAVSNAAWINSSSLLVARTFSADGLSFNGQLMTCNGLTGKVDKVYDMGNRSVASIYVPLRGDPQLLVLEAVGLPQTMREPDVQSSIRSFRAGVLGPRLIQFQAGEAFFTAAFAGDGRVALSGVQQGVTAAIYAVGDLKTGQIVWQSKLTNKQKFYVSSDIALSPDEGQFRARTSTIYPDLIFDMADGKSSSAPTKFPAFFAPDGKRFVRLISPTRRMFNGQLLPDGKKPHLKIAQIWER